MLAPGRLGMCLRDRFPEHGDLFTQSPLGTGHHSQALTMHNIVPGGRQQRRESGEKTSRIEKVEVKQGARLPCLEGVPAEPGPA